jgi:glutamine amidotransferase
MCIISAIPSNKQISKSTLKRCWENNPHGGGFMYTDGKKVFVYKEMTSFKRYFREFIAKREQYPQSSFVCHFRISTHGKINEENCHPFLVNDKLGFVHNGIIRNAPISNDYSDTNMFNRTILQQLPSNFLSNDAMVSLITDYIGSGSKLAFLDKDNNISIINEKAGQWDENGVWFSNGGYKETKYYDAGGTRVGTYGTTWGGGTNKVYYGSNVKQSSMGFASSVIPNISGNKNVGSKFKDIQWEEKLKNKVDNDVVELAKSSYGDKYALKCVWCDSSLSTYYEKNNECCTKCEDRYSRDWML